MAAFFRRKAEEPANPKMLSAVGYGAGVSIVAPAASAKLEVAQRGLERLRSMGFQPRYGKFAFQKGPLYFAGTTAQRLSDLHAAFADPTSSMVISLRGGYGSNYLLDGLDLELIRSHPKPFFGYSDLTALQTCFMDKIGMPVFHGPMVAADLCTERGVHMPSLLAALEGKPYSVGKAEGLRVLKMGQNERTVRGVLYGGCLSILVALLGTPFEPQTEGKLLFLEDVSVKPFQIDRMLWQMRKAGKFEGVTGIIFGEMMDCNSHGASPELLAEVIRGVFEDLPIPIAIGLRSGHVTMENVTLTLGVEAELNFETEPVLRLLEPAVGKG
jgi:muramoyltetrapeptide carboxypeptidase